MTTENTLSNLTNAVTFAVVLATLLVAHNIADHWAQSDHQATNKGKPGWQGRLACAAHVWTYTLVTSIAVSLVGVLLGLQISMIGFIAGQAISAVSHYWADRRSTLGKLAAFLGKDRFYVLGAPRTGKDDNPSLGTGAYALDQSFHWFWLFVAALLTAVL